MIRSAFLPQWRVKARAPFIPSQRVSRILVLTCLGLTLILFNYAIKFDGIAAESAFEKMTHLSGDHLSTQLKTYEHKVAGARAFAAATTETGGTDIRAYTSRLEQEHGAPDLIDLWLVQGMGTAPRYLETLLASQAEGAAVMSPLLHDESTGAAMGPHFILAQWIDGSADSQRWVVGAFSAEVVMSSMIEGNEADLKMRVVDVTQPDAPILMFGQATPVGAKGKLMSDLTVQIYGRTWQITYTSTPQFDASHAGYLPVALLLVGLLSTGVLGLFLRSSARYQGALKTTAALRERQLDARTQENRALIETNVLVVLVLDENGCIAFANEAAATLFRCTRNSFEGQNFDTLVTLRPGSNGHQICNAESTLECGTRLMLDVQSNKWRTADDTYQTTVLIRDVSEQINNRRQIDALHRRYDVALTGSGIGVFEIDLATGDAVMSDTWHQIMGNAGRKENFDHRRDFLARVHPDDLHVLEDADRRCIAGETERTSAEYRVRFKREWRWMYSDAVPSELSKDGRATRLIGTQCDVTELRHARNALEVSEASFRMMLEDAPVGMAILDATGKFIGVNSALSRLCGYDDDVMVSEMRLSQVLSRKSYVALSRDVRALLGSDGAKTYQTQVQMRTLSGQECWGLFNLSWTYDKNRDQYIYIAQIIDITQQKRVEQIKSEFIATISHELRTPLTSIKGALGLLEATASNALPDTGLRLLEIARVNADRLAGLVNNILDLEKISSGEVAFEAAPIPLCALIEDALEHGIEEVDQNDRNRVRIEGDEQVTIHADAGRIRQVVTNLLSNACKFSDPGTDVIVRFEAREGMAHVFFENTGAPIPESYQTQLFDAFTQLDASDTRSKGGTGLGLSIAREIVIRSGGEIGFEQRAARRTVFWFSCPLAQAEMEHEEDEFRNHVLQVANGMTVLHIEGDSDFCDVIATGFAGIATVTSAHSIEEARYLFGRAIWDAVIVDLALPDGDAFTLRDLIFEYHPQAQIIGLSSGTPRHKDPRIAASLIKSQVDIAQITALVADIVHRAAHVPKRAIG